MPLYKVTAVLGACDELIVPGGRFRRNECKRLAAWLDDLANVVRRRNGRRFPPSG